MLQLVAPVVLELDWIPVLVLGWLLGWLFGWGLMLVALVEMLLLIDALPQVPVER